MLIYSYWESVFDGCMLFACYGLTKFLMLRLILKNIRKHIHIFNNNFVYLYIVNAAEALEWARNRNFNTRFGTVMCKYVIWCKIRSLANVFVSWLGVLISFSMYNSILCWKLLQFFEGKVVVMSISWNIYTEFYGRYTGYVKEYDWSYCKF